MSLGGISFMVEKTSFQESPFWEKLDDITMQLQSLNDKYGRDVSSIPQTELDHLISILKQYNSDRIEGEAFESRKMTLAQSKEVDERIESALQAILNFHRTQPQVVNRKQTDALIISLFSTLGKELDKFKKTVENLKEKWKIVTQKVQGSNKSRQM